MNTFKKLLALLLVLLTVVGLVACGGNDTPTGDNSNDDPTAAKTEWDGTPQYGGHLNVHTYGKPNGLDPCEQTGIWKYIWTTCVWENALTRDADNNIAPGVCEYELSEDKLDLKLWVRENATFSDGSPVEIEDVKVSLERHLTGFAASATKYVGKYIQTMEIEGDVLHITFKSYHEKTMHYMAAYQTWLGIMPKEIAEKHWEAPILDEIEDCISTGPYKVVDFKDGEYLTIAKNEYYVPWEEGRTGFAAPKIGYLDTITFWYNGDNSSATLALLNGDYDMTDVVDIEYMDLAEQKGIVRETHGSIIGTAITFNTMGSTNACAKYADLRRAIMAAIDYDEFLGVVTDNCQKLGGSMCYEDLYDTDVWEQKEWFGETNQDVVDKYLELAREAGYNDQPVQVVYNTTRDDIPTLLCGYLDDAGINYELKTMEQTTYNAFIGDPGNNWDFYFGWPNYAFTPATLQDALTRNNYRNPEKDKILEALELMPVGSEEYVAQWNVLAEMMAEDCATAHMGTIDWIWYHPAGLHTNDEGLIRYVYNTFWENPEEHPSPNY